MKLEYRIFSCYAGSMSITQTVEVPASHRLVIDVPREVPEGPVILTFTPKAAVKEKNEKPLNLLPGVDKGREKTVRPLASLRGIHKGLDTMDAYFARKRADKAKEDAQIARSMGLDELPKTIKP
jgi:hypothetical protein